MAPGKKKQEYRERKTYRARPVQNKFMEMIQEQEASSSSTNPSSSALISSEENEIKSLAKKLGCHDAKGKRKLNREFEEDGLGEDFGDFLESLDTLAAEHTNESSDEEVYAPKKKKCKRTTPAFKMDAETQREFDLMQAEDAEFLKGIEDLPTDDELSSDEEYSNLMLNSEDELESSDEELRKNTMMNQNLGIHESSSDTGYFSFEGPDDSEEDDDVKEDIYGRVKDAPVSVRTTKYVPPHLRNKDSTSDSANRRELIRSVNGQLNRLSESNMESILLEFEKLYRLHSRQSMNEILCECIEALCCSNVQVMSTLTTISGAFITGLYHSVASEVGGFCIEYFVKKFNSAIQDLRLRQRTSSSSTEQQQENEISSKKALNLLLIIGSMYNFGTVKCILINDIFILLLQGFSEPEIEMLVSLMKNCGHQLRGDDQPAFKAMVLSVEERSAEIRRQECESEERVAFMLELIAEMKSKKSNNTRANEAIKERVRKMKKWIGRVKSRCKTANNPMRLTLHELLNADKAGRWWVVGGTWVGYQQQTQADTNDSTTTHQEDELLKLAAAQRMNTEVRKKVFCAIMGAQDASEAFDKLIDLKLKDRQEREIVRVLIDCCGQEKSYNPYYLNLAHKFCEMHNRFKYTFQLSFWDVLKQISALHPRRIYNLSCLMSDLVCKKSMALSCLKVVDFTEIDKNLNLFLQVLLERILKQQDESDAMFPFTSLPRDNTALCDGVLIFLSQVKKNINSIQNTREKQVITKRLRMVRKALDQ